MNHFRKCFTGNSTLGTSRDNRSPSNLRGEVQRNHRNDETENRRTDPLREVLTVPPSRRRPGSSLSRIVMTEGRALLDKQLTLALPSPETKRNTVSAEVSGAKQNDVSSTSIVPMVKASAPISTFVVREPNDHLDQMALSTTAAIRHEATANDPVLMMLLPASMVRWGTSWSDEGGNSGAGSDSFHAFMRDHINSMNSTDPEFTSSSGGKTSTNEESLWIEIGCSVFQAQLVKNVTLM